MKKIKINHEQFLKLRDEHRKQFCDDFKQYGEDVAFVNFIRFVELNINKIMEASK
jgi:hypothetical protein